MLDDFFPVSCNLLAYSAVTGTLDLFELLFLLSWPMDPGVLRRQGCWPKKRRQTA